MWEDWGTGTREGDGSSAIGKEEEELGQPVTRCHCYISDGTVFESELRTHILWTPGQPLNPKNVFKEYNWTPIEKTKQSYVKHAEPKESETNKREVRDRQQLRAQYTVSHPTETVIPFAVSGRHRPVRIERLSDGIEKQDARIRCLKKHTLNTKNPVSSRGRGADVTP